MNLQTLKDALVDPMWAHHVEMPKSMLAAAIQRIEYLEAQLRDVRGVLGLSSTEDPVSVIHMLRSWRSDDSKRINKLEGHLRSVLEIADTWRPNYCTDMDAKTLKYATWCLNGLTKE